MSNYYCSHKPPCCPQVDALKADMDILIKELEKTRCERTDWRTLALKIKGALEKMNVCDCRKGLGHNGGHLKNCISVICEKTLKLFDEKGGGYDKTRAND